jgi:hypothetical protein
MLYVITNKYIIDFFYSYSCLSPIAIFSINTVCSYHTTSHCLFQKLDGVKKPICKKWICSATQQVSFKYEHKQSNIYPHYLIRYDHPLSKTIPYYTSNRTLGFHPDFEVCWVRNHSDWVSIRPISYFFIENR